MIRKLEWNKSPHPREEWIMDYIWQNYAYYNKLADKLNSSLPSFSFPEEFSKELVVCIFAYNDFNVIKEQYNLLRLNLGKYYILYIDDSTDLKESKKIECFTKENNCFYWKVPRLEVDEDIDIYYHNVAINLAYELFLKDLEVEYIALLDHDIFPLKPISLQKVRRYEFYGKQGLMDKPNTGIYYPWPGFSFFRMSSLKDCTFNYFQAWVSKDLKWLEMDTGGSMYYEFMLKGAYCYFVSCERYEFLSDYFEVIDNSWIHLRDLSNWSGKDLDRHSILEKFLSNGLKELNNYKKLNE